MQPFMLHNKRTNWDLREQVRNTLNIEMSLKDLDIIQAIDHFNAAIQQAT